MKHFIEYFSPKAIYLFAMILASAITAHAEVIPIEPIEKGFFSSQPSLSMYWQGKNAKAVLLFIPGGEGYIGLKPGQTDHKSQFHQMLKRLTNPALTRGQVDVVLLDSPTELSPRQRYPSARAGSHCS